MAQKAYKKPPSLFFCEESVRSGSMAAKRSPIIELFRKFYYQIRNHPRVYVHITNRRYKIKESLFPKDPLISEIINSLRQNGIAKVDVASLFGPKKLDSLIYWVREKESELEIDKKKGFFRNYGIFCPPFKAEPNSNPFVQFYLEKKFLQIATAYLGYIPLLHTVEIRKTIPVGDAKPSASQKWHRDPEEKRILKIFLYLSDVDLGSGPFTYIVGSNPTSKGPWSRRFPQKLPHGVYPDANLVEKFTQPGDLLEATAPMGTIIFCDTAGLHRGGYATKNERIMATGFYSSFKYSELPPEFTAKKVRGQVSKLDEVREIVSGN